MGDRSSPTTEEYAVRIPASFVSKMRESSVANPTPLRNLHKDFLDLSEEMQVYVRIKPSKDNATILSISGNHVIVQPPKDSVSFKNRTNAGTKTLQKFKFNKIYDASVTQEHLFKDSAVFLVQDFLMGKSTLLFTYGATSAGKTYTMLGSIRDAGLIPRSLDVIFNSLDRKLISNPILKPLALNEVMKLTMNQIEAEELERTILMRGFDLDASDTKDSISSVSSGSLKDWNIRAREDTICPLQFPDSYYSVWVSYCEIYNEQAFDLLDGCDKKKKRPALRITEDRKGKFYVKGLKEIFVRSADDAVRVLLFGKENLHFAATKLNHNSSRSHCIFTVKIIRTNDCDEPTEASMNMMSFVDLAGMERTTKTQSRGERLKEAGNINTSLLVLGRCIDAMRSNQHISMNKTMIPYRESRLTRILQHYFSGQGRAAMFVNVSPSPNLCDETLHVLKFGALAQEVIIQPDRDISIADTSLFAPPLRPSRFQQYVRKSISILSARASVLEPSFQYVEEETDPQIRIQQLEEEIARLKADWDENEQKIRDECCSEWEEVAKNIEKTWMQRYEDTKARYEEFCENRVDLMAQYMNNCAKKKRKMTDEEDFEHVALKFKDKDDQIEMLEDTNQHLTEIVEKLKESLKVSEESRADLQQEMTRLQFEAAAANKPKINFCGPEVEEEECDQQTENLVAKLQEKLASQQEMLNEAVLEYHAKSGEMAKIQQENEQLTKKLLHANEELASVQIQLEKSNLLLSDANERLDVREEELMNLEEKLNKANGQFGNMNTELREAKRKIRDLESRIKEQNNASMVSNMCEDLTRQLLEAETKLEKQKDDIENLDDELSKCKLRIEAYKEMEEEYNTLRDRFSKAQLQLSIAQKELTTLQEVNDEMKARRESMLDEISHLKRDLELSTTERKHEEGSHSTLIEENKRMQKLLDEMRDMQTKLSNENNEFRKMTGEYESTIEELTAQMGQLREIQRERSLMEEELKTLAASIGRLQLEKSQMEKEIASQKTELEQTKKDAKALEEQNINLRSKCEEVGLREIGLKKELEQMAEDLKSVSENPSGSASKTENQEEDLHNAKQKLAAIEMLTQEKLALEKDFQNKFDQLEKVNEKLAKDALKHMMRANELSVTVQSLKEELRMKSNKCDILSGKINEFESQSCSLSNVQSQLVEKELVIRENESAKKSMIDELEKKSVLIEQLKQQNERVLKEKNQDINRLELELKSILSGHVNYQKPLANIKTEDSENEQPQEDETYMTMVTPTPVKARRGRAKKLTSPDTVQKEAELERDNSDVSSVCSTTRSRRTIKTDFAAPLSSTKSSGRKPRRNKADEEVAHPALSVPLSEEVDNTDTTNLTLSSKRRLYNSKCPDILLPSKKEELETLEFPKRMATRSRRQ